jgi:hypothetical protein
MKKVILLSGKMRVGKNQFANFLEHELSKKGKVIQDYFAKTLKENCREDFQGLAYILDNLAEEIKTKVNLFLDQKKIMLHGSGIINDIEKTISKLKIYPNNWTDDKTDITRCLMQLYGTQIFRQRVDTNYWVKQVQHRCEQSDSDYIIITDCRFPNEITEMNSSKYEIITMRINRNINTTNQSNHASEIALDDWSDWNYIISNDGSLIDLKNAAKIIADDLIEYQLENPNK